MYNGEEITVEDLKERLEPLVEADDETEEEVDFELDLDDGRWDL